MPYGDLERMRVQRFATLADIDAADADTLAAYPGIGPLLPAMGYGQYQVGSYRPPSKRPDCDVVVPGTPVDLNRIVHTRHPIRQACYELRSSAARPMRSPSPTR